MMSTVKRYSAGGAAGVVRFLAGPAWAEAANVRVAKSDEASILK